VWFLHEGVLVMWKRVAVLALAVGMSSPAWGLSVVTSPGGFVANDATNFAAVEPVSNIVTSPFAYTTPGGLGVTLSSGSSLTIDATPTFSRDFLPGQTQVFSTSAGGLTITFSQGIRGVATQVTHPHQGAYVAAISAFDTGGNLLGTFSTSAVENNSGDGSAAWLGVLDTNPVIGSIRLDISEGTVFSPTNLDTVLITDLQLLTGNAPGGVTPPPNGGAAIPEPASVGLLALAVGALGWRMRRR
jgi:hypothetical protein